MAAALMSGLLSVSVVVFSVSTMFSVGLAHTLRDVFGPMVDSRGVVRALLANFVLVPLLGYAVLRVLALDQPYAIGLMLVASAAGAPMVIKLTAIAGGNVALGASLTMLLMPITVLYMPFVVPVLVPDAKVSPAGIALPLLWTLIFPLCAGLLVRARSQRIAERLQPWFAKLGNVALVVLIVSTAAANARGIVRIITDGAILAPVALILGAFALGWVMGREYRGGHVVQAFGAAQRNVAAAMVVAIQTVEDPATVVMVVVASLVEFAVLLPIAWLFSRRAGRRRLVTA